MVLTVIVHQSHRIQGRGYAAFNAPIINQRQHSCVHDMMLYIYKDTVIIVFIV